MERMILARLFWIGLVVVACELPIQECCRAAGKIQESEEERESRQPYQPVLRIAGQVVDSSGAPLSLANVSAKVWNTERETKTNRSGTFELYVPKSMVNNLLIVATSADESLLGSQRFSWNPTADEIENVRIQVQAPQLIKVNVIDRKGNGIPDATVGAIENDSSIQQVKSLADGSAQLRVPRDIKVEFVYAIQKRFGVDYRAYVLAQDQRQDQNAKPPKLANRSH